MARYHAEGVRTVLVCCTGGEAGDILNPAMDTPEVKARLPEVRREELDAGGRGHRLRRGGHARLPRLGHARLTGQRATGLLRQRRPRRGHRSPGRGHPPGTAPGDRHLRRRPAPATRTRTTSGSTTSAPRPSSGPAIRRGTPKRGSRGHPRSSTTWCGPGPAWWPPTPSSRSWGSSRRSTRAGSTGRPRTTASPPGSTSGRGTTSASTACWPMRPRSTPSRRSGSGCPATRPARCTRGTTTCWPSPGSSRTIPEDDLFAGLA